MVADAKHCRRPKDTGSSPIFLDCERISSGFDEPVWKRSHTSKINLSQLQGKKALEASGDHIQPKMANSESQSSLQALMVKLGGLDPLQKLSLDSKLESCRRFKDSFAEKEFQEILKWWRCSFPEIK